MTGTGQPYLPALPGAGEPENHRRTQQVAMAGLGLGTRVMASIKTDFGWPLPTGHSLALPSLGGDWDALSQGWAPLLQPGSEPSASAVYVASFVFLLANTVRPPLVRGRVDAHPILPTGPCLQLILNPPSTGIEMPLIIEARSPSK